MSFKKKIIIILSFCLISYSVNALEIKIGHVGEPGSLFNESAEHFVKLANSRLAGKATVVNFGSSQLGSDKEMMQKVKLGTLDIAVPSTYMSTVFDEFGVFEMPYLIKDRQHMSRVEKDVINPILSKNLEEKTGYKVLAVWENGFRQITNNTRPINIPEDLKGIKLRVPEGKWRVRMFQAYGANPTPMGFSEVFIALKTGTIDGQENPYTQITSAKFQEVQKYLSITNHVYTPAFVIVHKSAWDKLPADVRKILEQAAKETQPFVYKKAAEFDESLLKVVKDAGVKINTANRDAFVKASDPIYKEFAKDVANGATLTSKILGLANTK